MRGHDHYYKRIMILALLLALPLLIPGSSSVWTDAGVTWAGNPFCKEAGFLLSASSPAIDAGEVTPAHCPSPGPNATGCIEWFGAAPDIGACEFVPTLIAPPSGLEVKLWMD